MKKIIFLFAMMFALTASAQKHGGHFSFIPRVGLNLSDLGDMDIYYTNDKKLHSKTRSDFMLGGEVEYQLVDPFGVRFGAYYSRQGCRWPNYSVTTVVEDEDKIVSNMEDQALTLQYLNIPLLANYYCTEHVSFLFGFQCGVLLGSNIHTAFTDIMEKHSGESIVLSTGSSDEKVGFNRSVVWSMPIGVGVEYENVLVDVRYNVPLSRFNKTLSKGRNQVWSFTIGYRI